jgi:hypothetical protein
VVPRSGGGLRLVEATATRTVTPAMAEPMRRLAGAWERRASPRRTAEMLVVHQSPRSGVVSRVLAPGVRALPWMEFVRDV